MDNIFEIIDKTERKIRLTSRQWRHIQQDHPNTVFVEDIKESLKSPIRIIQKKINTAFYYLYFKHRKEPAKYLKTIVKYLNGEGFVITSYFVKNPTWKERWICIMMKKEIT